MRSRSENTGSIASMAAEKSWHWNAANARASGNGLACRIPAGADHLVDRLRARLSGGGGGVADHRVKRQHEIAGLDIGVPRCRRGGRQRKSIAIRQHHEPPWQSRRA
jgi:hypothetical protein